MNYTRRTFLTLLSTAALAPLAACSAAAGNAGVDDATAGSNSNANVPSTLPTGTLAFNNAAWNYDAENDVYWQVGVTYCEAPAALAYESLGLYVPGAYLTGEDNGDGTFTCTVNEVGSVAGWTAATAPMVMPVNTAGYSAQPAPTSYAYQSVADYLAAGFVYVYAGCRGRDNGTNDDGTAFSGGAPWGAVDLKAAVRYLRYNAAVLPGNTEALFTFGHSGGGAQSAVMGASGDSAPYEPYLESIGAAMEDSAGQPLSDAIAGAMCWCPITCLDEADAAYEWMMGQYADTGTRADGTWTAALSSDLAEAYAKYVNGLDLRDESGTALVLDTSTDGLYASGSYYECVRATIEQSLNDFLSDTEFPYTSGGQAMADGGFGGGLGERGGASGMAADSSFEAPSGEAPSGGEMPSGGMPSGSVPDGAMDGASGGAPSGAMDGVPGGASSGAMDGASGGGSAEQTTYETAQAYVDALNADESWVIYDAASNTATIANVGAFVRHCKNPSKAVGAFDATDRSQAENKVFGTDASNELHFDATMTRLLQENAAAYAELADWDAALPDAYASDREQRDALGSTIDERAALYNPLNYLCAAYDGAGSSTVAPHWRVHSGIEQGDTSLTTELNLALALKAHPDVQDVEFAAVWGQGHTTAERTGDSTANFIAWVGDCLRS